jgi:hypothetical protein
MRRRRLFHQASQPARRERIRLASASVRIRQFRQKVDNGHAARLIHTVYGQGYMLRSPESEMDRRTRRPRPFRRHPATDRSEDDRRQTACQASPVIMAAICADGVERRT